jgi:hypothetical protein
MRMTWPESVSIIVKLSVIAWLLLLIAVVLLATE